MKSYYRRGMHDVLRAVWAKLRIIPWKEKVRLLGKLGLRLLGVKKHLFLGGYYREEDERQYEQDMLICRSLKNIDIDRSVNNDSSVKSGDCSQKNMPSQAKTKIREVIRERQAYIAIVVQNLDKGGLEEVVKLIALELYKEKIPVKIFCIQHGGDIAKELQAKGVEVVVFNGNKNALEGFCKADIPLIANTHFVIDCLDVFKNLNVPVVEVIHNMYVFLNSAGMAIEERKTSCVDQYIAVSEKAKEIFLRKFPKVAASKVSVIGNALKGRMYPDKNRNEIREVLGIEQDAFVYIMVGSVDARKNQLGVLRAWNIVKHITKDSIYLVIVGGGTDYEYECKVQKFILEQKLSDSVLLTGHTNNVNDLLYSADVFILDSYYEGWSIAATEALLCGLPIIHADCGSGKELVAEGKNGILIDNPLKNIEQYDSMLLYDVMHAGVNENVEQLVLAILNILTNKEYWREQHKTIRQYAIDNFSTSMVLDKYLDIFLNVLMKENQTKKGMEKTNE